jgi:hypothetical protein
LSYVVNSLRFLVKSQDRIDTVGTYTRVIKRYLPACINACKIIQTMSVIQDRIDMCSKCHQDLKSSSRHVSHKHLEVRGMYTVCVITMSVNERYLHLLVSQSMFFQTDVFINVPTCPEVLRHRTVSHSPTVGWLSKSEVYLSFQ